jgi:hypothetical protein
VSDPPGGCELDGITYDAQGRVWGVVAAATGARTVLPLSEVAHGEAAGGPTGQCNRRVRRFAVVRSARLIASTLGRSWRALSLKQSFQRVRAT